MARVELGWVGMVQLDLNRVSVVGKGQVLSEIGRYWSSVVLVG